MTLPAGVEITGPMKDGYDEILTADAVASVARLRRHASLEIRIMSTIAFSVFSARLGPMLIAARIDDKPGVGATRRDPVQIRERFMHGMGVREPL